MSIHESDAIHQLTLSEDEAASITMVGGGKRP